MRLVYFGSGEFGLPTLKRLVDEHHVALLVTQPDRPAGRHRLLRPTPACHFAQDHNIETIKPADIRDPQVQQRIHAAGADAFVVIAYGQKLPGALLDHAFAINLHGSLLPRYRGAAPINWAIINGENETGLSVIRITQRIDAGDVLAQRATPVDPMETAGELECRLADLGPDLVLETLANFRSDQLHPIKQDDRLACPAPKMSKSDATVHFDQPAGAVQRRIHGLTPWPGCTVTLDGRQLRVARVELSDAYLADAVPGELLPDRAIACAPGAVRLLEVQPPGGKVMSFTAFCHGHDLRLGCRVRPL
ncbi:MAG: methionyl-tRNA formyltransferase [Planctomycetota bacterium]|nr:methionyl-tRNA formyltransferase [Planctomycetota bacterium]